jgi:hypothetical protein
MVTFPASSPSSLTHRIETTWSEESSNTPIFFNVLTLSVRHRPVVTFRVITSAQAPLPNPPMSFLQNHLKVSFIRLIRKVIKVNPSPIFATEFATGLLV